MDDNSKSIDNQSFFFERTKAGEEGRKQKPKMKYSKVNNGLKCENFIHVGRGVVNNSIISNIKVFV